jgi:hypothetical protein
MSQDDIPSAYGDEIGFLRTLVLKLVGLRESRQDPHGSRSGETDESRIAWAFAHDDGSLDAGTSTAAMRNLEARYGAEVAKSLEGFVCTTMLTGRMRDVKISLRVLHADGSQGTIAFVQRCDGSWIPAQDAAVKTGDLLRLDLRHEG